MMMSHAVEEDEASKTITGLHIRQKLGIAKPLPLKQKTLRAEELASSLTSDTRSQSFLSETRWVVTGDGSGSSLCAFKNVFKIELCSALCVRA